jgi:hypothetical protein
MMIWLKRSTLFVLAITVLALVAGPASALNLRSPQVVFNTPPLQGYLNIVDPGINVATQQVDAQSWSTSITGNADFTLMLKTGLGQGDAFGVYNAAVGPPLFQVFPAGAVAGWFAQMHFALGNLVVTLFDQNGIIQGQTFYPGVSASNFGFYIQGPCGTWFSQDSRNGPGQPQMLTYSSLGNPGDFWLAWEECAFNPASTFDGVVINVQSIHPTPVKTMTWGSVKHTYR